MNKFIVLLSILIPALQLYAKDLSPIESLAERVTDGTSSGRIEFAFGKDDGTDYFSISSDGKDKVIIEGNNFISMAVGLNRYLKDVAKIHISWNNLTQPLPDILPLPDSIIRMETDLTDRYYLNYCTFSYSMPFWDEERWMKEIDWMALHGVNMPLAMTGVETVWKNLLGKLGYSDEEIVEFIPGPAYMAWWQMNNLEGWGGPLPADWFDRQEALQKKIVARMKELGINPVLPGYSGMVPRNFYEKAGVKVEDPGRWCGFYRPAFLSPEEEASSKIADMYYNELTELYGISNYYSMDPFHEGGSTAGMDLGKIGAELYNAMKRANPEAKWVIQSWQANPRKAMIDTVPEGEMVILDLYSEKIPKWEKIGGYGKHHWLYCMLLNFGGNVGMHGRLDSLVDGFNRAKKGRYSSTFKGIGATPEGIENNPIMYELLFDLPWVDESLDFNEWIDGYLHARYGKQADDTLKAAWTALVNTIYNAPVDYPGEGTVESIICARPSWNPKSASTWGNSLLFYSPDSTAKAARLMESVFQKYGDNRNFLYDFIDVSRQSNADAANRMIKDMSHLKDSGRIEELKLKCDEFLNLLSKQDSLLSILPDTHVNTWLDAAADAAGNDMAARRLFRENAAMLITVWGDSVAANAGGLHDYSHREWGGLIAELYLPRWKAFFDYELNGGESPDFYRMEKEWVARRSEE